MKKFLIFGTLMIMTLTGCATKDTFKSNTTEVIEQKHMDYNWELNYNVDDIKIGEDNAEVVEEVSVKVKDAPLPKEVEPLESVASETSINDSTLYKVTAYCPCSTCCGKSNGITATGTVATQGRTIAVDPNKIPYGTEVIINGHTYVAEDCGGAIKGNKIDLFFDNHQDALNWGVQYLEVTICE